tara:strand:- start:662 stop:1198 length:537 start_codon:yes stop_codon:yes gene_type:complete
MIDMHAVVERLNQLSFNYDTSHMITQNTDHRKNPNKHGLKTDENNRCPFEGCDWINKSGKKSTEQMHFSRVHPVECGYKHLTYSCVICKSNFRSRSDINQHHKNCHKINSFYCPECPYSAPQKNAVATHIAVKHEKWTLKACTDDQGRCVICAKQLTKTGHMSHLASCIGLNKKVIVK